MRRVQQEALRLFARDGFDAVTVEQVADAADVSPVSVYRYFGTKEGIVIWDEYDPPIFEEIARRLLEESPVSAVLDGLCAVADEMLDEARDLERIRLIHREPSLLAAADSNSRAVASTLEEVFIASGMESYEARAVSGAITGVLRAAVDQWQRQEGRQSFSDVLTHGFAALRDASAA